MFDNHPNSTVGMADPENMGVAVGISFLAGIEPDIYTGCNVNFMKCFCISDFRPPYWSTGWCWTYDECTDM
jgi:hypothetical protein